MDEFSITQPVAIGIDFGGTSIKLGLVAAGGLTQRAESLSTLAYHRADELLAAMLVAVDGLRAQNPDVVAIGAGLPGIVDSRSGIVHHLTNVPGWVNIALRDLLALHTGLPTVIENDANAMTYAEWKFGAGRRHANVICLTLGTGVGAGLILNGQLFRGSHMGAGEVGNLSIDFRGVPGPYGNFGALERYVGNGAIGARAAARYAAAGDSRSVIECTPHLLAQAAAQGDPVALGIWEETGVMLGAALADVVWLLNPDAIVLGGGVAQAGELIFAPVRRTIHERTSPVFHEKLEILPAELGSDAGLIGCGALAVDALPASVAGVL